MMIISFFNIQQDTVKSRNIVVNDSTRIKSDSLSLANSLTKKDSLQPVTKHIPRYAPFVYADTTAVCSRNSIADVTFYDSNNFISEIKSGTFKRFPITFTENNRLKAAEERATLLSHLKPGQNISVEPFHDDWVILTIVVASFLYSLIISTSKTMFPGVTRFFLLRGINDPASRDIGGLYHWQQTIQNLVSFVIISLFAYSVASYYDLIPHGFSGILVWLISLGIIITGVTLRHIVCIITGDLSDKKEVFREYLLGVYQAYRFSALFLSVIVILISYTHFLPVKVYIISGIVILVLMYLIRVLRLLIIFLNRNISILYLILYLCALEILPVAVSVKYFAALV